MGINKQIFADKLLSTSIPSNLPITDQQKRIESLQQNAHSLLPNRLYRFRTCSERSFDAFDKNKLWVSSADCMRTTGRPKRPSLSPGISMIRICRNG